MLEKLGEVLRKATNRISNAIFLDKSLIDFIIKELQRALIEADVNVFLVKQLSDKIRKAAFDENIKGIEKKEHLIKLLHDELLSILGNYQPLSLSSKEQNKILLLGLYGAGKTTTIAKLGNYFAKRGNKVALVGLDVHRPAAKEQLKQLAEKNKLQYFIDEKENDAIQTWKNLEKKGELKDYNVILIDTAGRHTLDKELITEISALNRAISPTEKILVMPADIGQAAKQQAEQFQEAISLSGVIITRMDSTAKAGGALTACAEIGEHCKVYFITTGEKINDIEEFNPESFLSRLLGMGDLQTLLEKIRSVTNEKNQEEIQKKFEEGKLSLKDVVEQVKSMNQIGSFEKMASMIPGFSKIKDKISEEQIEGQQAKVAKWEHIIKSMTPEEINNPEILEKQTSRISRVSKGAGVSSSEVRSLLKQYKMLNEMIKGASGLNLDANSNQSMLSQKQMMKLAKKFGKKRFRL